GTVDDPLEREADITAERVLQMPDPSVASKLSSRTAPSIQPQADRTLHRKREAQTEGIVGHTGPAAAPALDGTAAPQSVREVLRSPGAPLDATTRNFFEPRFGHDFNNVRVHTDAPAAASAREINAAAFTVGQHMVFGSGMLAPSTHGGRRLLAHE